MQRIVEGVLFVCVCVAIAGLLAGDVAVIIGGGLPAIVLAVVAVRRSRRT